MSYNDDMPVIPFRIDKIYRVKLVELAEKYDTSVNQLVQQIVKNWFADKGHTKMDVKFYV